MVQLKLKNPPIVEAVIDIECDLPISINFNAMGEETRAAQGNSILASFGNNYTEIRESLAVQGSFQFGPQGSDASTIVQSIAAFQAVSQDGKQIVQVRPGGYSFNRLQPYSALDDYLPEIQRTWIAFTILMKPKLVRSIRIRFINILTIPSRAGEVDLRDYIKDGPRTLDKGRTVVTNFLHQTTMQDVKNGNRANTVLAIAPNLLDSPILENQVRILFDNGAESQLEADPADWQKITTKLAELRDLKNHTFSNMLTAKCIALFQ